MFALSKYSSISHIVTKSVCLNLTKQSKKDKSLEKPVNIHKYPLDIICKIASFLVLREVAYLTRLSKRELMSNPDLASAPLLIEKSHRLGLQLFSASKKLSEQALSLALNKDKIIMLIHLGRDRLNTSPELLGHILISLMTKMHWIVAFDLVSRREDMPVYAAEKLLENPFLPRSLKAELLKMPKYQLLYAVKSEGLSDVSKILDSFPDISSDWAGRALVQAADQGSREKVLCLLQKRKDISVAYFTYALYHAISQGHKTIALDLLSARNDFHYDIINLAFSEAIALGQQEVAIALIPKMSPTRGIEQAAAHGRLEVVRYVVSLNRHTAYDLESAIEIAARNGHQAIVEFLRGQREPVTP